jgi:hypothetical protein
VAARRRAAAALVAAAAAVVPLLAPARAAAWGTREHIEIGRTAYTRACADLTAALAARAAAEPAVKARLDLACGPNLEANADVYGDATALAGDFLADPSEFLSQAGAWRFRNRTSYWLLALENSAHFNPMATQSWAEYHGRAVDEAIAGARAEGLVTVRQFQLALHECAFADHFLGDSFAAGHMGFNRTASSAAAAKSFHDQWNRRGRVVSDRAGHRWVTFGDGRLDDPKNQDARQHVIDASTASVREVLRAFVVGMRAPDEELAVWAMLPFTIQAPELDAGVVEIFERSASASDRELVPLVTTILPARKDTVMTGRVWYAAPFEHPDDEFLAAVAGFELAVPRVPAQTYLGGGGTLAQPGGVHSAVVETGVVIPIGLSLDTLVSHQIDATVSWLIRSRLAAIAHVEYQLNVELGDVLLNAHIGLAEIFPHPRTGWYAAAGLGFTFTAAGGGGL